MITTTAPTIDSTGIRAPTFAQILEYLKFKYRGIFGADVYLEPDSQDGQFLAVIASAINDANSQIIATYLSFSPATATGAALSNNVKINGIRRVGATNSTVDLRLTGQAGTTIANGVVKDANQFAWTLPPEVTIPPEGEVTVTATCTQMGRVTAVKNTVTVIGTPTRGWQTVTNPTDASPGVPVETDAALRARQGDSTAIPSLTVFEGTVGAVASVSGVVRYAAYENDEDAVDENGIPGHSICIVAEGGDAVAIAKAIAAKKGPGGGTYGNTRETVQDVYGRSMPIRFSRPSDKVVTVDIRFRALPGYTTRIGEDVKKAVAEYIKSTPIGGGASRGVEWDSCVAAAKSIDGASTFKIEALALYGNEVLGTPDVPLGYDEAATCTREDVTLTPV